MSWLFSQVLVEEYLEENFLDGEPCVQLNVMPTQAKFWRNDKMMDFSKLSQFGLTSQLLTESRGEELLMWFLEGFRARTSAQQEKGQELRAQEAECGKKWRGLLAKYDQNTHSWKTAQCSLLEDLEQSLQTWPRWGSMLNGECYQQPILAQTISEKESGLLPNNETFFHTPNTTGMDGGSNSRKALQKRLRAETPSGNCPTPTCSDVRTDKLKSTQQTPGSMHSVSLAQAVQMWPTPTVNMVSGGANHNSPQVLAGKHGINLHGAVMKFATPQASDNRDRGNLSSPCVQRRMKIGKQISLSQSVSEVSGRLNPTWVEWLMGWPLEWTDLKRLEMDKYPCVQQQHLTCLEIG